MILENDCRLLWTWPSSITVAVGMVLLEQIVKAWGMWFAAVDLVSAFFPIQFRKEDQKQISFSQNWQNIIQSFTYGHSFALSHNTVWRDLDHLDSPQNITLICHPGLMLIRQDKQRKRSAPGPGCRANSAALGPSHPASPMVWSQCWERCRVELMASPSGRITMQSSGILWQGHAIHCRELWTFRESSWPGPGPW